MVFGNNDGSEFAAPGADVEAPHAGLRDDKGGSKCVSSETDGRRPRKAGPNLSSIDFRGLRPLRATWKSWSLGVQEL